MNSRHFYPRQIEPIPHLGDANMALQCHYIDGAQIAAMGFSQNVAVYNYCSDNNRSIFFHGGNLGYENLVADAHGLDHAFYILAFGIGRMA